MRLKGLLNKMKKTDKEVSAGITPKKNIKKLLYLSSITLLLNIVILSFTIFGYHNHYYSIDIKSNDMLVKFNNFNKIITNTKDILLNYSSMNKTFESYLKDVKNKGLLSNNDFNQYNKTINLYNNIFNKIANQQQNYLNELHNILLGDSNSIGELVIRSKADISTKKEMLSKLETLYNNIIQYNLAYIKYANSNYPLETIIKNNKEFINQQIQFLNSIYSTLKVQNKKLLEKFISITNNINETLIAFYNNLQNYNTFQKNVFVKVILTTVKKSLITFSSNLNINNLMNQLTLVITIPILNKTININAVQFVEYMKYFLYYLTGLFILTFGIFVYTLNLYKKQNNDVVAINQELLDEKQKELDEYSNNIRELTELISALEKEKKVLSEQYNATKESLENQIGIYRQEIEKLNSEIDKLTQQLEEKAETNSSEVTRLNDKINELQLIIERYDEQIKDYKSKLNQMEQERNAIEEKYNNLTEEIQNTEQLKENHQQVLSDLKTLQQEYEDLKSQYNKLIQENNDLKQINTQLNNEIEKLESEYEEHTGSLFKLVDKYNKLEKYITEFEQEIKVKIDLVEIIKTIKETSFEELKQLVIEKMQYFTDYHYELQEKLNKKLQTIQQKLSDGFKKDTLDTKYFLNKEKDKYSTMELSLVDTYSSLLMLAKEHYNKLHTLFAQTNLKELTEKSSVMDLNVGELFNTLNVYKDLIVKINQYKDDFQTDLNVIKTEIENVIDGFSEDITFIQELYTNLEQDIDKLLNEISDLFMELKDSLLNVSLKINSALVEIFDNLLNADMFFDTVKSQLEKEKQDIIKTIETLKKIA
ncbi:hypothetical protein DEFDS_P244 (plasmid) [Deferribacter desulfuricans SSM1]|uniref:Uncharacterized protein n=1 Tax=Deferribacter desulfuricans (strain DSM 14783 / JCM 11476 / NBRC 101012 / SSM1) TaxID=639282 RepID=D3PF72_DEFDS|nr:hypothetical protein [Deferribacter desulfuricans]BAI81864.1 hypothetical protein DEFDS_P244 [Deferribacter desulfuricans SSM1]